MCSIAAAEASVAHWIPDGGYRSTKPRTHAHASGPSRATQHQVQGSAGLPRSSRPPAAGNGRLPRLTQFTQSGGWQTRRSPRRSTVGPDREGEQPAITRPSSTERKAVVRTEIANDGHALGVHRITSSARSNSDCGMARPSALAVFTLMHNSNRFGCSMGNSAGLAPLRIREA